MLEIQEWSLFCAHVGLVLFNMFGWIWKKTRVLHLITIGLTTFSWIVLGAFYGWGYCICMDYHASLLRQLNHPYADLTFIQLMFERLLGLSVSRLAADYLTIGVFVLILIATAYVWMRDRKQHRTS